MSIPNILEKCVGASRFCFEDGLTKTPNVTSLDPTLSRSEWSLVAIRAVHRRTPLCGGRLACRAIAPLRVVKMRRRSLRSSFLWNYREARSFSLRVYERG